MPLVISLTLHLSPQEVSAALDKASGEANEYTGSNGFVGVWALKGLWKQLGMEKRQEPSREPGSADVLHGDQPRDGTVEQAGDGGLGIV